MRIPRPRPEALLALALLAGVAAGCSRFSDEDAVALVRAYDRRLVEAYSSGDPRLVEDVAGPEEAKKILGLVGVKADMGIALHARLDDLTVDGVDRAGDAVVVRTRERWTYEDRAIATGARVGEASSDTYLMRYHLGRVGGRWRVVRVEFASPPAVGRVQAPVNAPPAVFHGATPAPNAAGPSKDGSAR